MNTTLEIVEAQIERVIRDLVDLDMRIAQSSGNVSVGMTKLRDISDTLKANAARAVHCPKVTDRERTIHDLVVRSGESIKSVAAKFGCSPSTVRRYLDKVTDLNCLVGNS